MERGTTTQIRILNVIRHSPAPTYVPITLATERGLVQCRYFPVEEALASLIWVGGVGGDWDSPDDNLFPRMCVRMQEHDMASLRVRYRKPASLNESVFDVLAGLAFLEGEALQARRALIGHSIGGAVVIQAAATAGARTVVALSTERDGSEAVADLPEDCSILLIHGENDEVVPHEASEHIYALAHESKRLVVLPKNDHVLKQTPHELEQLIYEWLIRELTGMAHSLAEV